MSAFPKSAQAYICIVILAGASVLAVATRSITVPTDLAARLVLALFVVSNIFADYFHIHLDYKVEITMSAATNLAALITFGPATAIVIAAIGSIGAEVIMRKPWYKMLFNTSGTVIHVSAANLVYQFLNDGSVYPLSTPMNAVALAFAGISYLAVNNAVVCMVVSLVEKHNPWDVARTNFKGVSFQLITLVPLGALIAIVYHQTPWGLILLFFPVLVTHYSFENAQKLRAESKTVLEMLADAVDKRDQYTFQHSIRVGELVERTARRFNMDLDQLTTTVFAARIHDLGKIGISSAILLKNGRLDPSERSEIEQHPVIGARIVTPLSVYTGVRQLIAHHHEHVDGTGYPNGLKGKAIPLGARILAVADAFDAMTTDRPYRKALSVDEAIAELHNGAGTQFDAEVVDEFVAAFHEQSQPRKIPVEIEMDFLAAQREG